MIVETQNYSFELNSKLSELKALNQHLIAFGRNIGLSEISISEINICLDELFTNIVLYGFKGDLEHIIKFTIKVAANILTVSIEDDGVPFNPLEKKAVELPADVTSAKIGGLGIHITRDLMDKICYERKRGKNKLTLNKIIQANGAPSA
jgi:anti-sigma regulatory factor (Ser/Thr protein kinase)